MPASAWARRARVLVGFLGALSALAATAQAPGPAASAGGVAASGSALEPAFRLAVGGLPLAPPRLDEGRGGPGGGTTPTLWYLSADRNLYALSEGGSLRARIKLDRPAPFLGLDSSGRPLVIEGTRLRALTRAGREAWSYDLGPSFAGAAAAGAETIEEAAGGASGGRAPLVVPGSDGRLFILNGGRLLCLNSAGRRLWELGLPALPTLPPRLDGAGRLLLALEGGLALRLGPFGQVESERRLGTEISVLAAGPGADQALVGLADGRLLLLKAESGRLEAVAERAAPAGSAGWADLAAEAGGRIYALARGGRLELLDASLQPRNSVETGVAAGRIRLYASRLVLTERGRALSLDRDLVVWRDARIRNAAAEPLPAPGGLLFSPGEDWILAVWRFEEELGLRAEPVPAPYARPAEPLAELLAYDPGALTPGRAYSLLVEVEKSLESGRIGRDEPRAAGLAAAFALGMLEGNFPAAERRFRSDPLSRATACRVLGMIGSVQDIPVLLEALRLETDPAVRAAACQALGAIGADPGGSVGAAFVALTEGSAALDEQVALALLSALEGMALRSGIPPGTEAVRAILRLASPPNGRAVRDRATRALGRIAGLFGPDRADGL